MTDYPGAAAIWQSQRQVASTGAATEMARVISNAPGTSESAGYGRCRSSGVAPQTSGSRVAPEITQPS